MIEQTMRIMKSIRTSILIPLLLTGLAGAGCTHTIIIKQDKPWEINVKVDLQVKQELADFFSYQDAVPKAKGGDSNANN